MKSRNPAPAPGVCLVLWDDSNTAHALTPDVCALIAETRPEIVCLHGGPGALNAGAILAALKVRALVPGVRLWIGLGCDWWCGEVLAGRATIAHAVDHLVGVALLAVKLGAECLVLDPEGAFEHRETLADNAFAAALVAGIRAACPTLVLAHTSYDHPSVHAAYPWREFIGPDGCDLEIPQFYVAPGQIAGEPPVMAPPGALAHRMATAASSYAGMVHAGQIDGTVPVSAYVQAHHTPAGQVVTAGLDAPHVLLWAAPSRIDAEGKRALRALCELRRRGYGGRAGEARRAVVDLGAASGPGDAIVGLKALAALEG